MVADDDVVVVADQLSGPGEPQVGRVRQGDGTTWRTVAPLGGTGRTVEGLDGMALDDGHLYLGLGGDVAATAGVYRVGDDVTAEATRLGTVGRVRDVIADVGLDAGVLAYTQRRAALPEENVASVVTRRLIRDARGTPVGVGKRTVSGPDGPDVMYPAGSRGPALSVSGPRSLSRTVGRYTLWGDGKPERFGQSRPWPPADPPLKQSGAWSLAGGQVRVVGDRDLWPALDLGDQPADLFGPRVLWHTGAGRVLYRNLNSGKGSRVGWCGRRGTGAPGRAARCGPAPTAGP
ncbi:hypothetical protein KIH74_06020 [Kineosporia sp. J2-2]|uniref:Uncharacterized protein n=1 Tax=Kineosporia corallincola TaxID=2835133 RepID=A0ABS5TBL2_9ACTN|nr:hypothetical protein [Kineosporia corallincola]MBT0768472.1 hypothetical protein [Kineosporia corallincola]